MSTPEQIAADLSSAMRKALSTNGEHASCNLPTRRALERRGMVVEGGYELTKLGAQVQAIVQGEM